LLNNFVLYFEQPSMTSCKILRLFILLATINPSFALAQATGPSVDQIADWLDQTIPKIVENDLLPRLTPSEQGRLKNLKFSVVRPNIADSLCRSTARPAYTELDSNGAPVIKVCARSYRYLVDTMAAMPYGFFLSFRGPHSEAMLEFLIYIARSAADDRRNQLLGQSPALVCQPVTFFYLYVKGLKFQKCTEFSNEYADAVGKWYTSPDGLFNVRLRQMLGTMSETDGELTPAEAADLLNQQFAETSAASLLSILTHEIAHILNNDLGRDSFFSAAMEEAADQRAISILGRKGGELDDHLVFHSFWITLFYIALLAQQVEIEALPLEKRSIGIWQHYATTISRLVRGLPVKERDRLTKFMGGESNLQNMMDVLDNSPESSATVSKQKHK
jgi:hypothetical protein